MVLSIPYFFCIFARFKNTSFHVQNNLSMKKLPLLLMAFMLSAAFATAGPVDVEKAKLAGKNFVASTFSNLRQEPNLQLVYTGTTNRDEPCFYVFNVDDRGFVILSADDRFRPITGYSDEGPFATENRSPELDFYLSKIIEARTSPNAVLYADAADEWQRLLKGEKAISRNGGRDASYLCETKWNQNYPYNLYAPEAASGPGGHCYAGCVATAMSQVMRYWSHPAQGSGSHSYYSSYGSLSANFGNTTYHWEHMPYHINSTSPTEDIEAVALFMYHCGVSVNMGFSPTGSGAYSDDVPYSIQNYFGYSDQAENLYRFDYSLSEWKNMLKEQFDLGWPVYYSGYSDSGGHAFVCDGYDDNDLFHFNWGWGGSSDGWFVVDEIDYSNWAAAIFNYVPTNVYLYMPEAPQNFTAESLGDTQFSVELSWSNPTSTIHGETLSSIDQVVLCRDGQPIHTFTDVTPGQAMTYTDHYLPTAVNYTVYAVANMAKSVEARINRVVLGPTCPWTVTMTSSDPQGWKGNSIVVTDAKGAEIATLSAISSSETQTVPMPLGMVSFSWKQSPDAVDNIHFEIKNGEQTVMTSFDNSSSSLKSGLFYRSTNSCQLGEKLSAPTNLRASLRDDKVELQWDMDGAASYSYFIYRDGLLYDISTGFSYVDQDPADEFHHYFITAFDGNIESDHSNYCNVQSSSECLAPSNLRVDILSSNKISLRWSAPQASGLSGYYVYRRVQGGEFFKVKALSGTTYETSINALPHEVYEFAVSAYYAQSHCESAFASAKANPDLNFVEVNRTVIPMHLDTDVNENGVTLVWLNAMMADNYSVYRNGSLLAEGVTGDSYLDATATAGETYCYTVVGHNALVSSNTSNETCVDWSTMDVNEQAEAVLVYPNPGSDKVNISAPGLRRVTVLNLLGQVVMTRNVDDDTVMVELSELKPGSYFIQIGTESISTTVKFVKP